MVLNIARFKGKVAIVTGASSGIGAAIAQELVKNGLIESLARRVERVEELAKTLSTEKGKLYAYKCDITKEEQLVSTIKEIITKLGNVHVLVNNAGLSFQDSLINGSTETWKTILDTNVVGLSIATREVVQNMKQNKTNGHIIHINSIVGHKAVDMPGISFYTASKFAVTALAETLMLEINREKLPIKVTSLSPGYVRTEFQKVAGFGDEPFPLPWLVSEDIADAVVYAISTPPNVNISEMIINPIAV